MFRDWDTVPDWLKPLAKVAVERGLIEGYPDGTLRADGTELSRAEYIAGQGRLAMLIEELADGDRQALMQRLADAVVEIRSSIGLGSGVLLSGGRILTNAHVVGDDAAVMVRWTSPLASADRPRTYSTYPVIKRNTGTDLAVIHVPELADAGGHVELAAEWVNIQLDETDRRYFAQTLYTQGSPVGLPGVLSRGLFAGHKFFGGGLYLTFSGPINPGNSGGGVFDTAGRLVGVVVAKPADAMVDGLGFAVPALLVDRFLNA